MIHLDLRTLFFVNVVLNTTLTVYLLLVWIKYREDYRGIAGFVWGMACITLGNGGLGLQGVLAPFLAVVASNTMLVIGIVLVHFALRRFFERTIGVPLLVLLCLLPAAAFVEQIVFSVYIPNLTVRIVSISVFLLIPLFMSTVLLVRLHTMMSLPGMLLIVTFGILTLTFLIRIPVTLFMPVFGEFLMQSGYHAATTLLWGITSNAWPFGFALLIAYRLQQKEEIRSREKTILLQELFHRTKNNMQVVSAFLRLQRRHTDSPEVQSHLQAAENRVQAICLVHKKLYRSGNLSSISLKEYIDDLVEQVSASYGVDRDRIFIDKEVAAVPVLIDVVVPVGMVLNELLSNVFRHAFAGSGGRVTIRVREKEPEVISIDVRDNGIGVPKDFDLYGKRTLGLQTVVNIIENQLSGNVQFETNHGFGCTIEFRNTLYSERI